MASSLFRVLVRHWMKRFRRDEASDGVRAVFLGDYVSTEIITKGLYERHQLDVLRKDIFAHLPANSLCLDIGANIGNHACYFAKHFDRVIAFEPNPVVCQLLKVNAMGRGIKIEEMGLSDKAGRLWFKQNLVNRGSSSIVEQEAEADFDIPVQRLDDYCNENQLSDIGFVKMDVEGHELKVLQGALDTLAASRPVLAAEGHFATYPKLGAAIEALLKESGYTAFYHLVPRHGLARWFVDRGFRVTSGPLALVLPEHVKRTQKLERIETILGKDHALFVAAHAPLPL